MFDFLKRKKNDDTPDTPADATPAGFFTRLKAGLAKTRRQLTSGLASLFMGKKELNQALLDDIETALLGADVGVETTTAFITTLTEKLARKELSDSDAAFACLKAEMKALLNRLPAAKTPTDTKPLIILMVGINGAGKTTTIGKLTHYYQSLGKNVLLAAGDTFRAAAIEQLQAWGERSHADVIAQQPGADTAAVIFDAALAARARGVDILLADTAGRLHTQGHLMAELQKVKRVLAKSDPAAPHEVYIVLDATLGQNALQQVKQFHQAIGVTGVIVTKLDGTAKGGIVFAVAKETGLPIRFIGIGEKINDLRPFQAEEFVEALFSD